MKKIIYLFVFFNLFFPVFAQQEKDFTIEIVEGSVSITGYSGTEKNVIIPSQINGIPVSTISNLAFYDEQITRVVIPDSVKKIGTGAFIGIRLESVTLPEGVSLEINSFNVMLYKDYVDNGKEAQTYKISYFTYQDIDFLSLDNQKKIGVYRYNGTEEDIEIPSEVNNMPVSIIESGAFMDRYLTSVIIPLGVTTIGEWAFGYNRLTKIIIPPTVTTIMAEAFIYNQISSITIPENVTMAEYSTFDAGFAHFYEDNQKKAGTYTCADGEWTFK